MYYGISLIVLKLLPSRQLQGDTKILSGLSIIELLPRNYNKSCRQSTKVARSFGNKQPEQLNIHYNTKYQHSSRHRRSCQSSISQDISRLAFLFLATRTPSVRVLETLSFLLNLASPLSLDPIKLLIFTGSHVQGVETVKNWQLSS